MLFRIPDVTGRATRSGEGEIGHIKDVYFADRARSIRGLVGIKILLVDDSADNRAILSYFLRSSGATVQLANNGSEGLAMAQAESFDLIFMDVQMPVLDGYGAVKQLRAAGCKTPIVALTAGALQGERERCLDVGFDDYLSKPVKPNELIDLAAKTVQRQRLPLPPGRLKSQLAEDPDMASITAQFVETLPRRLAALHQAQQATDWPEVVRQAHQMSGAAGCYGFPEISHLAAIIESQAKSSGSTMELAKSMQSFQTLCERLFQVDAV